MTLQSAQLFTVAGLFTVATISAIVGAVVVLPPSRGLQIPWWERARRSSPSRIAPVISIFLIQQIIVQAAALSFVIVGRPVVPEQLLQTTIPPLLGPIGVAIWMNWKASPRRRPISHWLAGCANAILLRFPKIVIYVFLIAALYILPRDITTILVILLIGAGGMVLVSWGAQIWVAQILKLARPALPRAALAADWAAERLGTKIDAVYEFVSPAVRVGSVTFARYILVSDSAATLLSDEELLSLFIHQGSYFQQPWLVGTLRVIESIWVLVLVAAAAVTIRSGGHAILIATIGIVPVFYTLRTLSRRAQFKADALAAKAAIDPTSSLRALERTFELNLVPVVSLTKRSGQPHLYDRMAAAGMPPPFPRPAPPSKGRVFASVLAATGTCLVFSFVFLMAVSAYR
jgi:Zn-dependent protease with chaperone function